MSLALLGYVFSFARDVPWWDDWDLVPVLSEQQPVTAASPFVTPHSATRRLEPPLPARPVRC